MDKIKFTQVTNQEFQEFFDLYHQGLSESLLEGGRYPDLLSATESAKAFLERRFWQQQYTPEQIICNINHEESSKKVGFVNYFVQQEPGSTIVVRLALIVILKRFRRKGYAALALRQLEKELVQTFGSCVIDLSVFLKNKAALSLYKQLGYQKKETLMEDTVELFKLLEKPGD